MRKTSRPHDAMKSYTFPNGQVSCVRCEVIQLEQMRVDFTVLASHALTTV